MAIYIREGEWKTLSHLAHLIRPPVYNMGIFSLQNDIDAIEGSITEPEGIAKIRMHLNRVRAVTDKVIQELKIILPQYSVDAEKLT